MQLYTPLIDLDPDRGHPRGLLFLCMYVFFFNLNFTGNVWGREARQWDPINGHGEVGNGHTICCAQEIAYLLRMKTTEGMKD